MFYSFRYTVVTKLTSAGLYEGLKRAKVGHNSHTPDDAHGNYIHLGNVGVKER